MLAIKTSLTLSTMAVVATGIAVGTGSVSLAAIHPPHQGSSGTTLTSAAAAEVASSPAAQPTTLAQPRVQAQAASISGTTSFRPQIVSRSDQRSATDQLKQDTLSLGTGNTMSKTENLTSEDPKAIAEALLASYGWSESQFGCLDSLWTRESNWNVHADNPHSSAYGIPQALPGSKMASAGADWANNAVTQIKWGLGYIQERYGSPCGAWGHSEAHGFY
jgi:hypothetical protein